MQSSTVIVDLNILADNIARVRAALTPGSRILFVVKSDAYGHGIAPVAQRAAREGVDWFGVVYLEEAQQVRTVAPDVDVLVMGPISACEVPAALEQRITPVVVSAEHARELGAAAAALGQTLTAHIKVDTGMGRLGVVEGVADNEIDTVFKTPGLHITGICSHLAAVDLKRPWLQEKQHARFVSAVDAAEKIAGCRLLRHFCSSRGVQYYPDWDFDLVRPGILLYGYGCNDARMRVQTRPFLQLRSRVMQVKEVPEAYPIGYYSSYRTTRDTRIAVVGMGYADGYLRSMSNRGEAIVHGIRVPVVGRISMNWITLDIGPDTPCKVGDEVVLIGEQEGENIWADKLGRQAGTIAYEILTAIHPRIQRQYIG